MLTPCKECKECKEPVSHAAKTCPKCGVADPGVTVGSKIAGALVLIGLVIAVPVACNMLIDASDEPQPLRTQQTPGTSTPAQTPSLGITSSYLVAELDEIDEIMGLGLH